MNQNQIETKQIMEEVLHEDYLRFHLDSYQIEEKEEPPSRIVARVSLSDQEAPMVIEGGGMGALDAFFLATRDRLADKYPSVKAIIFSSFEAKSVGESEQGDAMDDVAEVCLHIKNSYEDSFEFVKRSRSLLRASLCSVLEALEYFVNSERTYIRLYNALEHHRKDGRSDQLDRYTSLLSIVVRNTSYEEVSERLKKGEL